MASQWPGASEPINLTSDQLSGIFKRQYEVLRENGLFSTDLSSSPFSSNDSSTSDQLPMDGGADQILGMDHAGLALEFKTLSGVSGEIVAIPTAGAISFGLEDVIAAGSAGDTTHVPVIEWDDKGRLISVSEAAIPVYAPGGSDTQIQFNDGGVFGGDAGLTYNKITQVLTLGNPLAVASGGTGVATTTANKIFAGPTSGGPAAPSFRSLVSSDIPALAYVSSVGLSLPAEFTVSGSPVTSSGTLAAVWASQTANKVFASPDGSSGTPGFRALTATDIPALAYVTSVALTVPSFLSVSGSPITSSGTFTVTLATQAANRVFAGPSSGGSATPTFRALVAADIPALSYVSSVGVSMPAEFSVASSPVTSSGTIALTWAAAAANKVFAGPTSGADATPGFRSLVAADIPALAYVSSVGMSMPAIFSVASSPVTSSGTIAVSLANQAANKVWAGPTTGPDAAPTFRSLVAADIPALSYVTSIALTMPSIFSVSGSPITSSGTLGVTLTTQVKNKVFAGPISGVDATPTFRTIVAADLGTGTADSTTFLRGDLTWQAAPLAIGGSNTHVQFNNSGSLGGDSGFTYTTPGQIKLTPTSASVTVILSTLPASSQNTFIRFEDSSNKQNFQVSQESTGRTRINVVSRTGSTDNAVVALGPWAYSANGGVIGSLQAVAGGSGSLVTLGQIRFVAAEAHDATHLGMDIEFLTIAKVSTSATSRVKFTANGNVVLNSSGSAVSTSAVDGFVHIPSCAGPPTGTPTSYTGALATIIDSTNKLPWLYDGSNWRSNGFAGYGVSSVNQNRTVAVSEDVILSDNTAGGTPTRTYTLPPAASCIGQFKTFFKGAPSGGTSTAYTMTIAANGAEQIYTAAGVSANTVNVTWCTVLYCDGTQWVRVVNV